ncbi:MAG: RNA methyltransferase [Clostridia bacterium]|nr:RNA methyltransferase [Clostridia bacterium]
MIIVSKNNPLVKELSALKEKKYRKLSGTFLVEGEKMVCECLKSGLSIKRILAREDYAGDLEPALVFGSDAFKAICDEKTPQPVAAEVEIPRIPLEAPQNSCIVLDGVADPANVGAIVRTAVAAGYTEIYCIDCADPYAPKSVRASMSGVFFAKIMQGSREDVLATLHGVPLIAADMDGENVFSFDAPLLFALCIGNEGNGLSQEVAKSAKYTVKIPMGEHTESLNAAVSAGILMYLLKRNLFD